MQAMDKLTAKVGRRWTLSGSAKLGSRHRVGNGGTVRKWLSSALFFAALSFASWRAPAPEPPAFLPPGPATVSGLPSQFSVEKFPAVAAISHASSLAEDDDGRLSAAWYAGSREGARDVEIWFSTHDAYGWSPPRVIATATGTAQENGASVRKLGNPVLFAVGKRLHLWFVSVSIGGWSGSSINHKSSDDGGVTWSPAVKLITSPFFNIATLVRTPPVVMTNGELGLPIYHELFGSRGEWLRLDALGSILGKVRMSSPDAGLQPAVVAIDERRGLALLRSADRQTGKVMVNVTTDAGASWRQSPSLPINNTDSSIALLRLRSSRLLLAANPQRGRNKLQLFISDDDGSSWKPARTIEDDPDPGGQYSYPALLQTHDGRIHLTYTYQFRTIAHAAFTEASLLEAWP
jgi:predicted neuraminidase